jgi:formylglycine-generating enzyme required for sulfatase activity
LKYEAFIPSDQNPPGFYMDKYPVTCRDYELFLAENPAMDAPSDWYSREADVDRLDHPVTSVSWKDAQAYAQWAGKRLPSAKEWRRAAGSGRYPWGDEENCSLCNTRESSPGSTTPVGLYSPNGDSPFAVSDMAGNVWEWLTDGHSQEHQLLGGCWFYSIEFARVDESGLWRSPDTRSNFIGFRLCFDV